MKTGQQWKSQADILTAWHLVVGIVPHSLPPTHHRKGRLGGVKARPSLSLSPPPFSSIRVHHWASLFLSGLRKGSKNYQGRRKAGAARESQPPPTKPDRSSGSPVQASVGQGRKASRALRTDSLTRFRRRIPIARHRFLPTPARPRRGQLQNRPPTRRRRPRFLPHQGRPSLASSHNEGARNQRTQTGPASGGRGGAARRDGGGGARRAGMRGRGLSLAFTRLEYVTAPGRPQALTCLVTPPACLLCRFAKVACLHDVKSLFK